MSEIPVIQGECHPRFAAVRATFEDGFRERDECGAAISVVVNGERVVDLWGGWSDQARTMPWESDTLVNVYSCTKAMAALCALRLVEAGKLDIDAPVADYWPEFAQAGKERVTVGWLLAHRAGLAAIRGILPDAALYDWTAMTEALAAEEPWWTPGEQHGYHAVTFGWLAGELVRRVTGRSVGRYFREEIAEPLGADFHIGLDEAEHVRVAEMSPISMMPTEEGLGLAMLIISDPEGLQARAFMNPPSMAHGVNHAAWRSAEIPGANGHGTARALARIYGTLARGGDQDGVHLLDAERIELARTELSSGPDLVLAVPTRFGAGFMLSQERPDARFGPNPRAFGHPGAGGAVGFADPESKVGFGYVVNRMGPHILLDPRATALIDAVYASMR